MWQDLQELFYIAMGPFFYYVFLPVLVAGGVLMSIVKAVITMFRPPNNG
jgi:hypothetical protein